MEHKKGTTDLNKLGGLAKAMPITFVTCLIAALSISGVPPFNGFFSKWMIYQGLIELGKQGDRLWVIWLIAAMFGSVLTLASFMKLIHATFLGQSQSKGGEVQAKEVKPTMWIPMVVLAGLCLIFGVFAYSTVVRHLIGPVLGGIPFTGIWSPGLAASLILIGIAIGVGIYLVSTLKKARVDDYYVGGEVGYEMKPSGVDFYQTIQDMEGFKSIYRWAEKKLFDIYDVGIKFIFFFTRRLQRLHTGILPLYLIWCLLGMVFLFITFSRGGR